MEKEQFVRGRCRPESEQLPFNMDEPGAGSMQVLREGKAWDEKGDLLPV